MPVVDRLTKEESANLSQQFTTKPISVRNLVENESLSRIRYWRVNLSRHNQLTLG